MQVNIVGRGLNRNETRDIIGHRGESSHEIGSGMLIRNFELDDQTGRGSSFIWPLKDNILKTMPCQIGVTVCPEDPISNLTLPFKSPILSHGSFPRLCLIKS